jgi:osmoprotectant transport system substrate-binding protein
MKRITVLLAALAGLALVLAGCGSSGSSGQSSPPTVPAAGTTPAPAGTSAVPGTSTPPSTASSALPSAPGSVTIGSADFPENELLADIYGDAMSAKGVKVSKRLNIGERAAYLAAMKDGSIGAIPEYNGSILKYLDPAATAVSSADVATALQPVLAKQGFVALNFASAQDSDTYTVTKATAQKYHLTSIADLKSVASKLTFGAPAAFKTRPDGFPALKSVYGVTFGNFTPLKAGGTFTVSALKNGSIDVGDIFSTDPSIAANGFVTLTDPKNEFAAQNIVPIFSQKVLTAPMAAACNAVSAKLDTATLAKLVADVAGGQAADTVAMTWLKSVSLG